MGDRGVPHTRRRFHGSGHRAAGIKPRAACTKPPELIAKHGTL